LFSFFIIIIINKMYFNKTNRIFNGSQNVIHKIFLSSFIGITLCMLPLKSELSAALEQGATGTVPLVSLDSIC